MPVYEPLFAHGATGRVGVVRRGFSSNGSPTMVGGGRGRSTAKSGFKKILRETVKKNVFRKEKRLRNPSGNMVLLIIMIKLPKEKYHF